jgi:two-component sensor histidine kinase
LRQPRILLTCQSVKLMLDLDTVTALGLIVSELISNSYLHAFPQGNGKINVSLAISDQRDEATITLGDDGRGFQETGDDKRHGLGLVRRLVRQINGSVDLRSDHGTQWTLKLPVPKETYDAGSSSANGLGEARFVGRQ